MGCCRTDNKWDLLWLGSRASLRMGTQKTNVTKKSRVSYSKLRKEEGLNEIGLENIMVGTQKVNVAVVSLALRSRRWQIGSFRVNDS